MPELRWRGELETDPLASYMPVAPGHPWRSPLKNRMVTVYGLRKLQHDYHSG